jgi:hypothetical protein
MSVGKGSFFERVIRALTRSSAPKDVKTDRPSPIRWVSLR